MTDPYPTCFEIEIDRPALTRYLRARFVLTWAFALTFLSSLITVGIIVENLGQWSGSRTDAVLFAVRVAGIGIGSGLLVTLVSYMLFGRGAATRYAATLEVSVQGPFLRIREQTRSSDRKLHFRSIVDYATFQDYLMGRFGIHELQMGTTGGGAAGNVNIPGVRDCQTVRDVLADIDRLREDQ